VGLCGGYNLVHGPAEPSAHYDWDLLSRQTQITYGDGTTDSYSQYDADDNLLTLTQTFAGSGSGVTFSYGWYSNHQRQSTSVSNNAFQYVPSAPMTISYDPADADNGYTGSSSTPSGLSVAYTYDGNQNLCISAHGKMHGPFAPPPQQRQKRRRWGPRLVQDDIRKRREVLVLYLERPAT
jgi:hypothetical protein